MRLSADKNDPAYRDAALFAEVTLDGQKLSLCVTADEELGEAVCYVRASDGTLAVMADQLVTETLRGKVEICLPADAPEWAVREFRA